MKSMKKLASLLLALAMIFTLATTAFAAGSNSITVNNTVKYETYTIYKMLDLVVNDPANPTAFSYTVTDDWREFFTNGAGKDYVNISDAGYVTWKEGKDTAPEMIKFGQAAKDVATGGTTKVADGTSVAFTGLDNGYYLITSTLGTQAIVDTTPTNPAPTINEKNPQDTIEKTVKEDSTQAWDDKNDAQIGDTVNFKSTATLNPYTTNVKIYDTMDSGLTYTASSVEITGLIKGTEYTVEENNATYAFIITFTEDYLASLTTPATLEITYTAVLNENAVANNSIVSQTNKTKITYGDKQSVEDSTTTTTHKFSIFKHAEGSENNLAGAIFKLKKGDVVIKLVKIDDNNYRVANGDETGATEVESFETVANGDIVIWGVDADNDYSLVETDAPKGYNTLTEAKSVTVEAGNATQIDVENKTGTELPSTGGMGTTLFYVLGGVLVAAAVVLLVTKKRMAN